MKVNDTRAISSKARPFGEWTPTGDALPGEHDIVLFVVHEEWTASDGRLEKADQVECGMRYGPTWHVAYDLYDGESWPSESVTHWMPLPEPPGEM